MSKVTTIDSRSKSLSEAFVNSFGGFQLDMELV